MHVNESVGQTIPTSTASSLAGLVSEINGRQWGSGVGIRALVARYGLDLLKS